MTKIDIEIVVVDLVWCDAQGQKGSVLRVILGKRFRLVRENGVPNGGGTARHSASQGYSNPTHSPYSLLLIRRSPHLRRETPHGLIDSQFILFPRRVKNELMVSVESVEPREQHGCELDTGNAVCIIRIILFDVLPPELLVEC